VFPLGLPYISSSLKHAGYNVTTLNLNHYDENVKDLLEQKIRENKIDALFTGGLSSQFSVVRQVVEYTKKIDPTIITIVGGGLISAEPDISMSALEFSDFGIIGEGEVTSVELCRALEEGIDFNMVNGIIHRNRNDSGFTVTQSRKEIIDIDTIPWPDYEGFELEKNLSNIAGTFAFGNQRVLYTIASRSCPYSCTFCFHTTGKKYRRRSLDKFFEELDYLVSKYDISAIFISDELFASTSGRVQDFCSRIMKYNITWSASFRVDSFTQEMAKWIKDTKSCTSISFGLESADNRILKSMNKKTTFEQIERALNLCFSANIPVQGNFIFGDIEETVETSQKSLDWLKANQEKFGLKVNHVIAYPGTFIYRYACEKNLIKNKIKFLKDGCPQINISKMTDQEYDILTGKIASLVSAPPNALDHYTIYNFDDQHGFIGVKGICSTCGCENDWKEIRLFQAAFMVCQHCGRKYSPPVYDPDLVSHVEQHILRILKEYGKVAIWGMHDHMVTVFKNSKKLSDPRIFPVDNSPNKQSEVLFGKKVYSPDIINSENIPAVIVAVPWYYGIIQSTIEMNYPMVKKIIDITSLIGTK
jgi:anaerobic magnesium-protoporphyrin IX monomethyl ester cyclase